MRITLLIVVALAVIGGLYMVLAPTVPDAPAEAVGQAVDDAATGIGDAADGAVEQLQDGADALIDDAQGAVDNTDGAGGTVNN